jgi:nucleotide-binding universal stress UspA family protein
MVQPAWTKGPPKKILLATDLSCRCDRALDRSTRLAKQWGARLMVLHVLDPDQQFLENLRSVDRPTWRRPNRVFSIEAQVRRDLLEDLTNFDVRVEEGDPAVVIDEIARMQECDLIVTGVARDEPFGRNFLGATVDRLVRRTPVPILIVKSRMKPYREIVVATDFSESSRHALNAATSFFPDNPLTLLHTFEVPFAGLLDERDESDEYRAMIDESARKFLSASELTDEQRSRVNVMIEQGVPELVIRAYMLDMNVNLVITGTHGTSIVFEVLIGSTAKRILESTPGDALLIREPWAVDVK